MENPICPTCTHKMERAIKPMTLPYKGRTATFDMPGRYCPECGESVHTGKDMQVCSFHPQPRYPVPGLRRSNSGHRYVSCTTWAGPAFIRR
ncbi:MAG: YgiT-type zinc finger protein [Armatimonadetes bacterium]|nr:YgiT-type zinc finger protein [Armatimonadota bacterium]